MSPEQAEGRLDAGRPGQRRLQPGGDPLLPADRPDRRRRSRTSATALRQRAAGRVPAAAAGRPAIAAGPGGDLPEGDGATARRTATPRPGALADDIEHWLADEPVSAWPEPVRLKLRRWVNRNRTLVSSAAAAILVAATTGGYLAYEDQMGRVRRQVEADARVDALSTAEVRALQQIVDQLGTAARWSGTGCVPCGRTAARSPARSARRWPCCPTTPHRHGSCTIMPSHPRRRPRRSWSSATGCCDTAPWRRSSSRRSPPWACPRSRSTTPGCGGSACWPWPGPIGADGPNSPGGSRPGWCASILPSSPPGAGFSSRSAAPLDGPLRAIYADRSGREPRALAFSLLLEFASRSDRPDRPEALAGLLTEADPDQFQHVLRRLGSRRIGPGPGGDPPVDPAPARGDLRLAEPQSRLAPALLALRAPDLVWPMLAHHEDPTLRTEVIQLLPAYGIDPAPLVDRLRWRRDAGTRRALILCLGGFAPGPSRRRYAPI